MTSSRVDPRRPPVAVHPQLAAVFGALESASMRWALLRTPSRPEAPTGDVDLIVHPGDAGALTRLLRPLGFAALPWRATAPELVFVSYHRDSGTWLVLDVVTEVSFGPDLCFRVADADVVLRNSQASGAMRMLAPDDAFWALLLHCLLEKDAFAQRHRAALSDLAGCADPDGPLATVTDTSCPPGWDAGRLIAAVRGGRWHELELIRQPLRDAWLLAHPGDVRRSRRLRTRRLLRGPLTVVERRGVSVVLLGPNGAGKSTVAARMLSTYPAPARLCYLGLWKQSRPVGPVRAGVRVLARPAVVWGRYATSLAHRSAGRLVLFDRYVYDALLPPKPPLVALKRPYLWLLAHSCPPPTATVLLDVPGEVAWERKGESSVDELEQERRSLRRLSERGRRVHVVDATRSVDEVAADVTAIAWACYAARWKGSVVTPEPV
jgi:thymidylate kinase